MIVGDAANFLLGGIPGDLHDEFVMDVEPADLAQASVLFEEMSGSVRTIHVKLSGSVASLEGRWQGDGAAAFDSEIWQPLSRGLGVLERECGTAASELARLAAQAEQAHLYKVAELNQEIQTQLWIFAGTSLIGSPELGGVISDAVGGLAARLGGELVGRIVAGIVDAVSTLLRKVLDAFGDLLKWAAKPIDDALSVALGRVEGVFGRVSRLNGRASAASTPGTAVTADGGVDRAQLNLASGERTTHILTGDATGGGHLWPGLPGKSPFPAGWTGDMIMRAASDIATDPSSTVVTEIGRRSVLVGERDGVRILVVTDGRDIISAYPTNLPRNP